MNCQSSFWCTRVRDMRIFFPNFETWPFVFRNLFEWFAFVCSVRSQQCRWAPSVSFKFSLHCYFFSFSVYLHWLLSCIDSELLSHFPSLVYVFFLSLVLCCDDVCVFNVVGLYDKDPVLDELCFYGTPPLSVYLCVLRSGNNEWYFWCDEPYLWMRNCNVNQVVKSTDSGQSSTNQWRQLFLNPYPTWNITSMTQM